MAIGILAVLLVALTAGPAAAELKTYVKEYAYRASKADNKESSRAIAGRVVKRLLVDALAADLESLTQSQRLQLTKDHIAALSAGIVRMDVENERWHDRTYRLTGLIAADPDDLIKRIDVLRERSAEGKGAREIKCTV